MSKYLKTAWKWKGPSTFVKTEVMCLCLCKQALFLQPCCHQAPVPTLFLQRKFTYLEPCCLCVVLGHVLSGWSILHRHILIRHVLRINFINVRMLCWLLVCSFGRVCWWNRSTSSPPIGANQQTFGCRFSSNYFRCNGATTREREKKMAHLLRR